MIELKISLAEARSIAVEKQLTCGVNHGDSAHRNVLAIIDHLGYVQIDTISVIKRAHHHTIWTRYQDYNPKILFDLHEKQRAIFEYWGHAASYLPMSDYRYYMPLMMRYRQKKTGWISNVIDKHSHLINDILDRIRVDGPLSASTFASKSVKSSGGWWNWKPAKCILEILFWQGYLMISKRQNFQKIYDLTERVLPQTTNTNPPSDDELSRFIIFRTLQAHGIATENDFYEHIPILNKSSIYNSLRTICEEGAVIKVCIENLSQCFYMLPETLDSIPITEESNLNVCIINPFDNLVILRKRILNLFNFNYALECYLPPGKRKFGYFVLPVLWNQNFVGRMDAKADRKKNEMVVNMVSIERDIKLLPDFITLFTKKLQEFAFFNECDHIKLDNVTPSKFKNPIQRQLQI